MKHINKNISLILKTNILIKYFNNFLSNKIRVGQSSWMLTFIAVLWCHVKADSLLPLLN